MGALLVDQEQLVAIEAGLDRVTAFVADQVPQFDANSELHGYEMFQGRGPWESVPTNLRIRACIAATGVLADSKAAFILRAINVDALNDKYSSPYPEHHLAVSHALESIQAVVDWDHKGQQPF